MPRGGARPGAGRPKKSAPADAPKPAAPAKKRAAKKTEAPPLDADGYKTDPNWPFGQERPPEPPTEEDLSALTPLDFLLQVMRDKSQDDRMRMQAAQLAAPYVHAKKGESTKKAEAEQKAKAAGSGRFSRRSPPKLVAAGGKSV